MAETCNQRKQNGARCEKSIVTKEGTCYQHRPGFYRNYKPAVKRD